MSTLSHLQPTAIWYYFEQITQIPRPSKHEEQIIAYLIGFARERGLDYTQDGAGNLVIRKPATPGMEQRGTVILQSHVDMVCEKNNDVVFDFERDPIRPRMEGGWVKATGTTLGADCGIGMAAALAALAACDIAHGPLECLFTVDEETGLTGAFGLGEGMLTGRYLINLDSEDEGQLFIGCAGGIDTLGTLHYTPEAAPTGHLYFRVALSGLTGGHSGDDIDKGRGNANKLLGRFLWRGVRDLGLRIVRLDGGNLRNAIPREAWVEFGVPLHTVKPLLGWVEQFRDEIKTEYGAQEPELDVALSEVLTPERVMDPAAQRALAYILCGLPNGVLAMSHSMKGLVETSTNLASVKFQGDSEVVITTSQRSSLESARNAAAASVKAVMALGGARVIHSEGYPGWNPNPNSYLLEQTKRSYERLFDTEPAVRAIHAGLECGLFLQRYPQLEMVSFGPTLRGVHSPEERLEIASVERFWALLVELLGQL